MRHKYVFTLGLFFSCVIMFTGCKKNDYNEAVQLYEEGAYTEAYKLFQELPSDYEKTSEYIDKIDLYEGKYTDALSYISKGKYQSAKDILAELPEDYKHTKALYVGMDKLEILLAYNWKEDGNWTASNYGWRYYDDFYISVVDSNISLHNHEEEYSGDDYMGDYDDVVPIDELLLNDNALVTAEERTDFDIDISELYEGNYKTNVSGINQSYSVMEVNEQNKQEIENYNNDDLERMYSYIQDNQSPDNLLTYQYLKKLKENNYKDSKEIYKELYDIKLEYVVNDDYDDCTTNNPTHKYYQDGHMGDVYIHLKLSGGIPGGNKVQIKGEAYAYDDGEWIPYKEHWSRFDPSINFENSVYTNEWSTIGTEYEELFDVYSFHVILDDKLRITFSYTNIDGEEITNEVNVSCR